ncbi:GAF domain-containing protein [Pseudodesulfovibrio cashew]|uniref:GAF domain-containing protein n=1 Tax=Pseudodesulfovibrio cashew TaxID=2678688 RepID=A0A6I6JE41_9BACT|nr:HD domain-containing phosphohydrolase [Pseudodesulfovibrio cashew]QGY38903.1 GAF domain-containing protein [Pseudodesulfovibrio cashew]
MTPLKKFIRPGVLRNLLRKAFGLTGGECPFAIVYEGEVVLTEGVEGLGGFDGDDVLSVPLQFDMIHGGEIRMRIPTGTLQEECLGYKRLLVFVTQSIQELIDTERARRSIADEALSKYRELALLHRSVLSINTSLSMRDVIGALINECRRENFPGELGMVFLSEPGSKSFHLAAQFGLPFGLDPQSLTESELFFDVINTGKGEIINDLSREERWQNEVGGLASMVLIPIASPNRTEGVLVMASENKGLFEAAHRQSLITLASVAGISVSNAFNFEGIQTLMNAILQALAEAIDSRDPFTAGHSERVAHLAVAFCLLLSEDAERPDVRFSDLDLREIYYSGILHDVGKIGIKEDVLTKKTRLPERHMEVLRGRFQLLAELDDFDWAEAFELVSRVNRTMCPDAADLEAVRQLSERSWRVKGDQHPLLYEDELAVLSLEYGNLTPDERCEIQRHPAESERILQHIPMQEGYKNMLTIIRQHHERLDGSGYPDKLTGDDILLQSRIMSIVDIYDAVTQERHYKPASTRSEAIKILRMEVEAGKLDKSLVDFFIGDIERIERLSERVKSARINHLAEISHRAGV